MNPGMEENPGTDLDTEFVPADDAVIGRAVRLSGGLVLLILTAVFAIWLLSRDEVDESEDKKKDLRVVGGVDRTPEPRAPSVVFRDITKEAGIRFVHANGARGEKLLPETMGGGAAFFDYDGDGDQDILFVNGTRWPHDRDRQPQQAKMALYANDGKGTFSDLTAAAGLAVSAYGMGVAVGDVDGDGDTDLFLTAVGPNLFFRNEGGVFRDATAEAGLAGGVDTWSSSAGFFDYDGDGDLDLFVCNYVRWSREIDTALAFTLNGTDRAYGPPRNYQGTQCYLYRNDGRGKFADVSEAAGIHVQNPSSGQPVGKALALVFRDLDSDGRPDVIVANDTVQNFLFHNLGGGRFEEIGFRSGVGFDSEGSATGAMGIDAAHYRNDAALAVAIGNFANEMTSLYVSSGELQFSDDANVEGIGAPSRLRLTFGLFFFDYDLDGRVDLLQTNGHIEDAIQEVQPSQTHAQPAQLFWNCGRDDRARFVEVPGPDAGDLARPIVGRGACYADIDGDLDLDVLLTQTGGPPLLLRNEQKLGHHVLRLVLEGTRSNRDAIGARVVVQVGGRRVVREVSTTCSYLSQVERPVTIGLGASTGVDSLVVHWPSGQVQKVDAVKIDAVVRIVEPE